MENFVRSAVCYLFLFGGAGIGSIYILSDVMEEKHKKGSFWVYIFLGLSYGPFWYSVENGCKVSYAFLHVLLPPIVSILTSSIAYKIYIYFSGEAFLNKKETEMTKKDKLLLLMMIVVVFMAFMLPMIILRYNPIIK